MAKLSGMPHRRMFKSSWAFVCGIVISVSLSSCGGDDFNFHNANEAINCYSNCLRDVRSIEKTDADGMIKVINRFQTVCDTVGSYLMKDTIATRNDSILMCYFSTTDSIKVELVKLSEKWHYSFRDLYSIKRKTSQWLNDEQQKKLTAEAEKFFCHLDSAEVPNMALSGVLNKYRGLLNQVLRDGINNKKELLYFFEEEDLLFRAFLTHFRSLEGVDVGDITRSTERIFSKIARQKNLRENMDGALLMTYISMRNSRRIIQNAAMCMDDINRERITSRVQASTYMWLVVQPFTATLDAFSMATLTERDQDRMQRIADAIPQSGKFAKEFGIEQNSLEYLLPQQLLKMYIVTLKQ